MSQEPHSIGEVVHSLEEIGENHKQPDIGDLLDAFGSRSFAPLMLVIALLALSPVGGIPGVPTAMAALIAIIALQMLAGLDHIWLPAFVQNRSVSGDKLTKSVAKLDKIAAFLDGLAKGRLKGLAHGVGVRVVALLILGLCCMVPPLELIPFAAAAPMLAIAILSLAIMVRDGLAILIGGAISIGALGLSISWLMGP